MLHCIILLNSKHVDNNYLHTASLLVFLKLIWELILNFDLSSAEDIEDAISIFMSKLQIAAAYASLQTFQHSSQHKRGQLSPDTAERLICVDIYDTNA